MKTVSRSALLPYSAKQMFEIVNDVSSYEDYLPWCSRSEVLVETAGMMEARLDVSRAGISQSFTTRNEFDSPASISLHLVDGPFNTLEGKWLFTQLGDDGCKVEMDLKFDFNQKMLNVAFSKVFQRAADTLVDAFCERAHELYGAGTAV